ncbi:MAG: hypothetical protein C0198_00590 [Sulfurihydrogenibium sp.]|nr:MAG: hypothetical protein C0198_00590 [Sulfurihydrogenibium sp.]
MSVLEERVSIIEETIMRILYIQQKNEIEINKFHEDVKKSKENMEKMIAEMKQDTERFKQNVEKMIAEMKQDTEKLKEEMKEFKIKIDRMIEEMKRDTENPRKELQEERRNMNKQWGELSNKMGTIVEDIIFPATEPVLTKYFNCDLTELSMNIKRKKNGLKDEFDVVAVSKPCKTVFLIEVKATLRVEYINEFKDKKINRFRELFSEYSDYKLIPIIASLRIEDDILNYLTKNRIYAMAYREWDYMDILNFDELSKIQ